MADARTLLVEFFLALERAGERPSMNRAILAARAVGAKFRNAEAYMWLGPFSDGERPKHSPDRSHATLPEVLPAPLPASFICPLPEVLPEPRPEGGENRAPDRAPNSPPRAREKFELVPIGTEEEDPRERATLTLPERARLFCAAALDVAIDAGLLPNTLDSRHFVAANEAAAQRLIQLHGDELVDQRWRKMIEDVILGNLHRRDDISVAFLARVWSGWKARSGNLVPVDPERKGVSVNPKLADFAARLDSHTVRR